MVNRAQSLSLESISAIYWLFTQPMPRRMLARNIDQVEEELNAVQGNHARTLTSCIYEKF